MPHVRCATPKAAPASSVESISTVPVTVNVASTRAPAPTARDAERRPSASRRVSCMSKDAAPIASTMWIAPRGSPVKGGVVWQVILANVKRESAGHRRSATTGRVDPQAHSRRARFSLTVSRAKHAMETVAAASRRRPAADARNPVGASPKSETLAVPAWDAPPTVRHRAVPTARFASRPMTHQKDSAKKRSSRAVSESPNAQP